MLQLKVIDTADVPAVMALQAECYGPAYLESAAAFEAKLRATRGLHCSYLAVDGDRTLGYVVSLPIGREGLPALDATEVERAVAPDSLYLHDLAVSPAGRAQRLGHKLVQQVVQRAQDMGLRQISLVAVQGSADYWQRLGFRDDHASSAALAHQLASFGPDARLMRRDLVPA